MERKQIMKDSTATSIPGGDTQVGQSDEAFENKLNVRMDEREHTGQRRSEIEQDEIFTLTLDLQQAEANSEDYRKIVHELKRDRRYLAVAATWEEFMEFVGLDVGGRDGNGDTSSATRDKVNDGEATSPTGQSKAKDGTTGQQSKLTKKLALVTGHTTPSAIPSAKAKGKKLSAGGKVARNAAETQEAPEPVAGASKTPVATDSNSRRTGGSASTGAQTPSIRTTTSSQADRTAGPLSNPDPEEDPRPPSASKSKLPAEKKSVNRASAGGPERSKLEFWAQKIAQLTGRTVGAFVELGRVLLEAKDAIPHGGWLALFENGLTSLSLREAEKLMKIAGHPVLSNSANWSNLPGAQQALLALSRLSPTDLEIAIEEQKVKPTTTIHQAEEVVAEVMGTEDRKSVSTEPPVFDAAKAVARCLKPINKAIEAAGEKHRDDFLDEMVAAIDGLRASVKAV